MADEITPPAVQPADRKPPADPKPPPVGGPAPAPLPAQLSWAPLLTSWALLGAYIASLVIALGLSIAIAHSHTHAEFVALSADDQFSIYALVIGLVILGAGFPTLLGEALRVITTPPPTPAPPPPGGFNMLVTGGAPPAAPSTAVTVTADELKTIIDAVNSLAGGLSAGRLMTAIGVLVLIASAVGHLT